MALHSTHTGAGRIRGHWPSDLIGPAAWGWDAIGIHEGEHVEIELGFLPEEITQLKWARVLMPDYPYEEAAKVWFWVEDCSHSVISLNADFDLRGRYRLDGAQVAGRCILLHAYGYQAQPEGTGFWSAYYAHSGDPSIH